MARKDPEAPTGTLPVGMITMRTGKKRKQIFAASSGVFTMTREKQTAINDAVVKKPSAAN